MFLAAKQCGVVIWLGAASLALLAFSAFNVLSKVDQLCAQYIADDLSVNFNIAWLMMLAGGILLLITPLFTKK